jgi:hypothetical protein
VISLALAAKLRAGGLRWEPARGDRFVVYGKGMDEEIFVLSDMTIEASAPSGDEEILRFNGTTEWALDSIHQREVVWLPREDQLRNALRGAFRSLTSTGENWRVDFVVAGRDESIIDSDPEEAYGRALLRLVTGEM